MAEPHKKSTVQDGSWLAWYKREFDKWLDDVDMVQRYGYGTEIGDMDTVQKAHSASGVQTLKIIKGKVQHEQLNDTA